MKTPPKLRVNKYAQHKPILSVLKPPSKDPVHGEKVSRVTWSRLSVAYPKGWTDNHVNAQGGTVTVPHSMVVVGSVVVSGSAPRIPGPGIGLFVRFCSSHKLTVSCAGVQRTWLPCRYTSCAQVVLFNGRRTYNFRRRWGTGRCYVTVCWTRMIESFPNSICSTRSRVTT